MSFHVLHYTGCHILSQCLSTSFIIFKGNPKLVNALISVIATADFLLGPVEILIKCTALFSTVIDPGMLSSSNPSCFETFLTVVTSFYSSDDWIVGFRVL